MRDKPYQPNLPLIGSGQSPVSKSFGFANKTTPKPDLSAIIKNTAVDLDHGVKASLQAITNPHDPYQTIQGWRVRQHGIYLECRFLDDRGINDYRFKVTVPDSQPFLYQGQTLPISVKAHALMLIQQSLPDDIRQQFVRELYKLEQACFDPQSGQVVTGPTGVQTSPNGAKVICHFGLNFPPDAHWMDPPSRELKAMEWQIGLKKNLIDLSQGTPLFIEQQANTTGARKYFMSRTDALRAAEYAEDFIKKTKPDLHAENKKRGLWKSLEFYAHWYSVYPQPVPTP